MTNDIQNLKKMHEKWGMRWGVDALPLGAPYNIANRLMSDYKRYIRQNLKSHEALELFLCDLLDAGYDVILRMFDKCGNNMSKIRDVLRENKLPTHAQVVAFHIAFIMEQYGMGTISKDDFNTIWETFKQKIIASAIGVWDEWRESGRV